MKIIVSNKSEYDLMKKFLFGAHEMSMIDLMEETDGKENKADDQYLNSHDYRILHDAISCREIKVEIDESEKDLVYEETDFVEGECVFCKTITTGLIDGHDDLSYEEYLKMIEPDGMSNWRCENCSRLLCPCCSENLISDEDNDECDICIKEKESKDDEIEQRI